MPLNKTGLLRDIKTALTRQATKVGDEVRDQETAINQTAEDLADAIDKFVRSGDVITEVETIVAAGIPVASAPVGATIGQGKGKGPGKGKVV